MTWPLWHFSGGTRVRSPTKPGVVQTHMLPVGQSVEALRSRVGELTDYVIARAVEAGLPVRSLPDWRRRGGLVNIGVGTDAEKVCHALLDRDVCTDFRGDGIRVSPHFFSTHEDVDRLFEALADIL